MATIHSGDLTRELIEGAKIQVAHDNVPSQIAEKVVPVMETNPKLLKTINIVKTNNGVGGDTLYTTPTDKDCYIVAFISSASSTAAGTNTLKLHITPKRENVERVISSISLLNTVNIDGANGISQLSFPPILLKRGTNIRTSASGTIATTYTTIFGYEVDD